MQRALMHAVVILLEHDGAAMEHQDAIGKAAVDPVLQRRSMTLRGIELDVGQALRVVLERLHRAVAAPDLGRRHQFAHVLKGPAIPRRPVPVPVWYPTFRRYRKPLHDVFHGSLQCKQVNR